jgi:hypothetical protein
MERYGNGSGRVDGQMYCIEYPYSAPLATALLVF